MDFEQLAYALPSARNFIDGIAADVGEGVSIVLLADNLSREMATRLIRDRLNTKGFSVRERSNAGESDPVTVAAEAMDVRWSSGRTLRNMRNLLSCDGLPDVLLVRRIGPRQLWTEFIEGWAREWDDSPGSRNWVPSLCVIGKLRDFDSRLPKAQSGISFHWWWGFPSALEMRLACRFANEQEEDGPEASSRFWHRM